MSIKNADTLFKIFKIKNPNCDADSDGIIKDK
jgi:hypothetical protein